MTFSIPIRDSDLGATFAVRVHPRAGRTGITGTHGGALKVVLASPPVEGRANECLVEFFSGLFNAPRSAVQIIGGGHARDKIVRISGRSASEIERALQEHFIV